MPYYGDGAPYYYGGPFANHSSLMTGVGRTYHNPIAARYSPHLSTISETPFVVLRRYSPAAPITTTTTSLARPRRIIDTADIDVSKPPRSLAQDNRQQRHRLRRDRPTIKIRSQALKDNPALREYNEKHEKTVGELLVEKFLIKEKDKQSPEEEGRKMRLYHQASLMSNNLTKEQTLSDAERENDILAAIRRRVTRRMTRRKSSVGVVPLDPEQIEREAAFHAAQAEALDTLVAEEQAELEVEIRRGTFAKKQVMRLPVEISEVSETEDDEKDEEDRKDITLKKHTTTKKKKKKKIPQTPSPSKSDADEDDSFEIPESVIEEEEFEWDDREKCDDISKIVPLKDDEIVKKDLIRTLKSPVKVNEKEEKIDNKLKKIDIVLQNGENKIQKDVVKKQISAKPEIKEKQYKVDIKVADRKEKEKKVSTQDTLITEDKRVKVEKIEAKALKEEVKVVKNEEKSKTEEKKIRKEKVPELNQLKRTISAPQKEINETDETTPRFKVEACNSVGDFSTLFVKAANSPDENFKTIEQFRESIRLPAPRRLGAPKISNIETEVVLPVRKPYILDTSRNSVYLALKSSQNVRQGRIGADDRPSIIIDETRKESNSEGGDIASIDSRPAKSDVIVEDQSKPLRDSIISEERDALKISDDTVSESAKIEENFNVEFKQSENKSEAVIPLVNENFKKSKVRHKEEFVAWWDETEETPETESEKKSVKSETNDILEKSKEKIVESVKTEIEVVKKIEPEKKIENISDSAKTKVETKIKAVSVDEKIKNKVKTLPKTNLDKNIPNKISTLRDKSKEVVGVVDKSVETVLHENKQKADNKILNAKEKVTKSALEKEVKREEKLEQIDAQKKTEPLPKVSSEDEREKLTSAAKEITARAITLSSNKDESVSSPVINRMIPEQKRPSNDLTKLKCELPKLNRYLSNIPEEPKSTSPTEKEELFTNKSKTNDTSITSNNKSLFAKEETNFPVITKKIEHQPFIKPNLSPAVTVAKKEKDERKKKVDTKAVMKIEKKILEDAESPRKILTTAIPETQIIETAAFVPVIQKEDESSSPEKKVGLQPTKKKSSELAAAPGTEIDFWSEIKAQESVKVSGTLRKVQSRSDSPSVDLHITKNSEQSIKPPENLKLDLSKINRAVVDQEDVKTPLIPDEEELKTPLIKDQEELKTPLIPDHEEPKTPLILDEEEPKTPLIFDQEDPKTPLISDPSTPLIENQTELPTINIQSPEERISSAIQNGEVNKKNQEQQEEEPKTPTIESECSGTVKKISKWTNHDNLSNLNETDADTTPVASKEVSPSVSVGSTTTKKKIVKRKKSATPKKKDSSESPKTGTKTNGKTSAKTKIPTKKTAASPQTSQLKVSVPMSASGSPRNTPSQRPPDLMKLFYTTPPILLTATPRDLRKVRRAKVKRKKPPTRTPSLSSDSTGSTRSTATTSTEEGSNCEEDAEHKRKASTRSNDSGFDGSPRLSTPSQSSDNQRNADGDHYHHSGRVTPPATNLPRFKKYEVTDFNFLKVLGKGSFGKVLLAELRGTECVYAVKCLKKDVVLEDDDVECTLIERKVLTLATRHPYLCHLFCTFQTESHLFFVMEYLNGGDLMFHIQKSGRFSEQRAKFYAAEIWSGLIFLHKKGIVYRDLKLDNVLLDFEGHIRIADFGMCKLQIFLDRTADTFCGTPDYMAPEIIKGLKYNQAVDWWSYGVLLYEMLTGQSPFSGCDEDELFWSICNERPFIPRYLSQSSTDILVCLLEKDAGKRIPGHEIACHPFFCTIAWDKLERRSLEAPFKPAVEHTLDTRYFDTAFTTERPRLTPVPDQILTSMDQAVFRGFSYTNPNATD